MHALKKIIVTGVCCIGLQVGQAQYTKINQDPDELFKQAKEFYQKEQYALALPLFKSILAFEPAGSGMPVTVTAESKFYTIVCALKLNDALSEQAAKDFIAQDYHAARVQLMCFHMGEYYFRQQRFSDANAMYTKAGIDNLSNAEVAAMTFHKAYGYFTLQQFAEAKQLFNTIRQMQKDPNYIDANYYYGFISFYEKNYKQALESFKVVETNPSYQNIVPFYIAEIYYFNGERDKAIDYTQAALKKGNQYYALQMKQLLGHSLFEKRKYAAALPYLEEYVSKNEKVRREDLYELSYCYYEAGSWTKSIQGFKQLGGKEDSLAQNSMYLLADAYLKVNDKANARNAFLFCASNNSNAVQKEISLFSYAKLSYELGYMDIAAKELQGFIAKYPQSRFILEAKELQISVMANTSNYKEALALFEALPQQSETIKKIYPKILYGRAVELINDQQIDKAEQLFDQLLQMPYNSNFIQFVHFWKGEIAYRKGNTDVALGHFQTYLKDAKTNGEINLDNARYNVGYCLLKKENYKQALSYFQMVAVSINANSSSIQQDAYLRSADCYFMLKDLKQAAKLYDDVYGLNTTQADYALYQKGIIAGANGKTADKISLLQSVALKYPNSSLVPEANMEIANTYLAEEKWQESLPFLDKIIKDKRATALHPQGYLKSGVAYFNLDKNQESLTYFKKLVVSYPNSAESDDAVEYIRRIFVEDQKPGEFVTFMRENGKAVSYNEEDSLTYRSAMIRYEAKDFEAAKQGFSQYVSKFPEGRYALECNYFLAEIYLVNKNTQAALTYYNAVAAKAPNRYAERSALQSARIYYFDLKEFDKAEQYYNQLKTISTQQETKLEAMRGLLRCQYKQQKWNDAVPNAQDLLKEKGLAADDKLMANMVIAKSYQLNNKLDEALAAYKTVTAISKSEFSAEAAYRVAEILLAKAKYADAEKAGLEVIKKYGSYEYWVTKSYLLLGDIYFAQKDYFNAEATYKSVAENATIADLKKEAQDKLAKVIVEKDKVNKVETPATQQ